ncbi:MAG: DNA-directed RNA polymerase subunit omega [Frisingicoccus sp.]|uniref:DNA-directed RNA polymerase subunit omega n=1 Tax=Frisingicoccus sp. TaxID=1918627 RepID=UPI0015C060DF|nr:DNA-directed RNA polymerase subunit omega [Frisingicoccus sp.]MEE0752740.1 DNA-directed RNA polymerase subunit omega [Frisingicoccus sp.]
MLHPSYSDLIRVVNSEVEEGEQPVVQSRYSIVIATAKRARQIIAGAEPLVEDAEGKKPLSIAVEELYNGAVKILGEDEEITDEMVSAADEASAEETAEAEEPEEETVEE